MVACFENIPINDEQMEKYMLDNYIEFNRQFNPDIYLSTVSLSKLIKFIFKINFYIPRLLFFLKVSYFYY